MNSNKSLERKLEQTIRLAGFRAFKEVATQDIDKVFELYVRLYRQKKLSVLEVSWFCDCFFRIAHFGQILETSKYANEIFFLCDVHVDMETLKTKKMASNAAKDILDNIGLNTH